MSDDNDSESQEKYKMYENLLRSYQEELEKKTKESLKLKVDLDLLNTKYTTLINKKDKELCKDFSPLQAEIDQKNSQIENLKSTLSTLKESLKKAEKKNSLFKLEIEKKEAFIKEILYEKKQVEMALEEKNMEIKDLNKFQQKQHEKKEKNQAVMKLQEEYDVLKNINKTLITLLKWKNVENEQLKNSNNQNSTCDEEDYEDKMTKFKAQEEVLLKKLADQMKEFSKFDDSSFVD